MDFKPIKPKKIYEEIVSQLQDMMVEGLYNPGDKLPSEREMAEVLGVSRPSVREAITALAAMGILEVRPGEGTFVAHTSDRETIKSLAMILAVERNSLAELMEVRRILECEAAAMAAGRANNEDIELMEDLLTSMKATAERREQGVEFDLQFHFAVAQATHNRVLHRLINTLDELMHQTFILNRQEMYSSPGVANRIISEHEAILDGIKNHQPRAARQGMNSHLSHVQKGLERD
ncbi:MAG: FadR/GntR family transcriptional regulator [Methanomassiliicoccales archaeon]